MDIEHQGFENLQRIKCQTNSSFCTAFIKVIAGRDQPCQILWAASKYERYIRTGWIRSLSGVLYSVSASCLGRLATAFKDSYFQSQGWNQVCLYAQYLRIFFAIVSSKIGSFIYKRCVTLTQFGTTSDRSVFTFSISRFHVV